MPEASKERIFCVDIVSTGKQLGRLLPSINIYGHHGWYLCGKRSFPPECHFFMPQMRCPLQAQRLGKGAAEDRKETIRSSEERQNCVREEQKCRRCRMGGHRGVRGLKIDSSTVGMESARSYRSTTTIFRRFAILNYHQELTDGNGALHTAVGENTGSAGNTGSDAGKKEGINTPGEGAGNNAEEAKENVQQSAASLQDWQNRLQTGSSVSVRTPASQTLASIRQTTIRYIFDLLFSARRNRLNQWMQNNGIQTVDSQISRDWQNNGQEYVNNSNGQFYQNGSGSLEKGTRTQTLKVLNYNKAVSQTETEATNFSTVGTVRTADGREINFNVNVGMSRSFQQYYEEDLHLMSFTMCDPLVINLDTDVAELSDQTFYFDIDGDGEKDEVSQLGKGSGYLALDKNGDGVINDGSELFGTASGNGFADLAAYDEDGNGWIDENDAIWSKLKIWCKDENGNDVLYRLADKGVGAICLQNAATDFTLKGQEGQTRGAIRNTGVFLYENGNVGTVQHVDVAKYYAQA